MKKSTLVFLAFAVLGIFAGGTLSAEEAMPETPDVAAKLNAISDKQDEILKALAEIKEELHVVKVRATLNS